MTEKIKARHVAQDFANQDLLNVKLKKLGSDPTRVEGVLQYQEDVLKVAGASAWITLADNADLAAHIADTANPHDVTLEQARSQGNQLSGNIDANSNTIVNLATPSASGDAANKGYVDSAINVAKYNFDYKDSVRASVSANVDLASELVNAASLGGVTLATGDRVLLRGQTDASENGIYVVAASGAASRSADADASSEVTSGMYVYVEAGTDAGKVFILSTVNPITLDTTDLVFGVFSGTGYTAGDGIDLSGTEFSVDVSDFAGSGLEDDGSNNLRIAAAAAGNGLTGGAGSALAVLSDTTGGANLAEAINVSANGVAVKVDGVTIQGNGSDQLEIKSSVFGSGLSYSSNIATVNWASQKYNMSFDATTDWGSENGDGQYVITVLAATHGLGTEPVVLGVVGIDGSSNKYGTELYHEVNTSGDVLIYVTGSTARFAGKLYLVKA